MKVTILAITNQPKDNLIFVRAFSSSAEGMKSLDRSIINYVSDNLDEVNWNDESFKKLFNTLVICDRIDEAVELVLERACLNIRITNQEVI